MIRDISSFLLWVFLIGTIHAQDLNNYEPLKSNGEIPEHFRKLALEKFEADQSEIDLSQRKQDRKAEEKFLLSSHYWMDELLSSGKVMFNDPVSNYVNQIADELLKSEPELREQIHFYVLKTPTVNAFASDQGIILINLGLIAQLENEAQLAFVMAHEITHFKKKHSLDIHMEHSKIEKKKASYSRFSFDDRMLAKSSYSKEKETEADAEGYELYVKSKYSMSALEGVFDVLQYSYLPFDDREFKKNFFEQQDYIFPDKYFLEEVQAITGEDDYDDSYSNHPNVRKRRESILRKAETVDDANRADNIIADEDIFNTLREVCRFESCRLFMQGQRYADAIYSAYMLLETHPDNKYLEHIIAKSLYYLSTHRNAGTLYDVLESYKNIEGNSQQVFHLFKRLKDEELNTLAVKYAWELKRKYEGDAHIDSLAHNSLHHLVHQHDLQPEDFHAKWKEVQDLDTSLTEEEMSNLSKYEKIKLQKKQEKTESDKAYYRYAFVDLMKYKPFVNAFDEIYEEHEKQAEQIDVKLTYSEQRKKRKQLKKKGQALGIEKLVVLDPTFMVTDQRKKDNVKFVDSEKAKRDVIEKFKTNAAIAGLELEVLEAKSLGFDEVDKFNDISFINEWLTQRLDHDGNNIYISNREYVNHLVEKYGTPYYAWTGVVTQRERNTQAAYYVCLSLIYLPFLPLAIIYALNPQYNSVYYTLVFDIDQGDIKMVSVEYFNDKARRDILNSFIYDTVYQLKNKRE